MNLSLPPAVSKLLSVASEAESLAAEIMMKKREMIDFDRKRQQTMEALAQFRTNKLKTVDSKITPPLEPPSHQFGPGTVGLISLGSFFIELPSENIKSMLEQDRKSCDSHIEECRRSIKSLIFQLQKIRPSDLEPELLNFILKEAKRVQEGKEMEIDPEDEIIEEEEDGGILAV